MIKLKTLLTELIDIYSPSELIDKGIKYDIFQESSRRFTVNLNYKNQFYSLRILPVYNPKRPSINFGSTDNNYENLDFNKLLNSPNSPRILAAIFGLLRYWVDKYNIQEFEYGAEGKVRNTLYTYYLKKHFSDFENTQEDFSHNLSGDIILQVWKKI